MEQIIKILQMPFFIQMKLIAIDACFIFLIITLLKSIGCKMIRHLKLKNEPILIKAYRLSLNTLMVLSIAYQYPPFQTFMLSLLASGGIVAIVIGLAAQEAFGNLISGLMILLFKPFAIHDLIKINHDLMGTVEGISLRHTTINTYENTKIIIPNSAINKATLENISATNSKGNALIIQIAYESNLDLAMQIMKEEILKHPDFIDTRTPEQIAAELPAVTIRCTGFLESGVELKTVVATQSNAIGYAMLSDLRIAIKKRFDEHDIEIPYPHVTLTKKNPV